MYHFFENKKSVKTGSKRKLRKKVFFQKVSIRQIFDQLSNYQGHINVQKFFF